MTLSGPVVQTCPVLQGREATSLRLRPVLSGDRTPLLAPAGPLTDDDEDHTEELNA